MEAPTHRPNHRRMDRDGPGGEVAAAAYTWDEESHTLVDSAGWVHPHIADGDRHCPRPRRGTARRARPRGGARRLRPAGTAVVRRRCIRPHDPDASGARALLDWLGYSPEREFLHTEIDVPDGFVAGEPPAGIVIRPRTESDDRDIVAVMADAFEDPWDYEEARQEFSVSATYDPSLWFIAVHGDEAVGALFGYVTNGRGQISALGVREAWRRRGIAQGLLRAAFARFRDRGVADVRLNVDRENETEATHLYELAGMRLRRRWLIVTKTMLAAQVLGSIG